MTQPRDIKRKRGGQPKPEAQRRSHRLLVNFTAQERDQVRKSAELLGESQSAFVLRVALAAARRALRKAKP